MTERVIDPSVSGFSPDEHAHLHEEGAIRHLCRQVRSHETGLPEWLKNAKDMYVRIDAPPEMSMVGLLYRDGRIHQPSAIGCLDLGGMSTADIERKFRVWADPEASGSGKFHGVEGEHGNGGKCYMTQMFERCSYIHTLKDGRASKYGFAGGGVVPGYFPDAEGGRGYPVDNPDNELDGALSMFRLRLSDLPEEFLDVWDRSKSFTLVLGMGAKQFPRRLPVKQWAESLRGHPQMVETLLRTRIFTFHNGSLDGPPLRLFDIKAMPGAEAPRLIEVPKILRDPATDEPVETAADPNHDRLVLRTSEVSMRYSLKTRHTIIGWSRPHRTSGFWPVPELSRAPYANKIYGDLYLAALEDYKDNLRQHHADAPLTRALQQWLSHQIDEYSGEFVKLDRLQASEEDRNELSAMNRALDMWKNRFLEHEFGGAGGQGEKGAGPNRPRPRLPRGEPARLVLHLTHQKAGQGVTFRPALEFLDNDGGRVRAVPFEWTSSDWAVATVDGDLNLITTHCAGETKIAAVCKNSGLRSNEVGLEVLDIAEIALMPQELAIAAGSRSPIFATALTRDGRKVEGAYLIWTEGNSEVVSVGSGGMVFGLKPGTTEVSAGDDQVLSDQAARVTVTEADAAGGGESGYPKILLSEIDDDPLGEGPPVFSPADPPVHQRPQDVERNIWWINMGSPLARRYVDSARGSGARSQEWRSYLIERYIEVMVKVVLTYDFEHGEELTFETMLRRWDEEAVNMQSRVMETLQTFLDQGALPEQN